MHPEDIFPFKLSKTTQYVSESITLIKNCETAPENILESKLHK